jgi:uncharacterized membrane protein YphA (DoxX/SURF4 family)
MSDLSVQAAGLLVARTSLAIYLLPAGVAKLRDPEGFIQGVRDYGLLPAGTVKYVARTLPLIECAAGVALLAGIAQPVTGLVCALLIAAFITAVTVNLRRGRRIDCNCYGVAATKSIGAATVARNAVLLALSLSVVGLGLLLATGGQWFQLWDPGWGRVTSAGDALLLALLTSCCLALIYLSEWALDVRAHAKAAIRRLNEASP